MSASLMELADRIECANSLAGFVAPIAVTYDAAIAIRFALGELISTKRQLAHMKLLHGFHLTAEDVNILGGANE